MDKLVDDKACSACPRCGEAFRSVASGAGSATGWIWTAHRCGNCWLTWDCDACDATFAEYRRRSGVAWTRMGGM